MSCISRASLCPASGDTENVLLQKILQSLNAGGGGVTSLSLNGGPPQTGAVDLTVPDGALFLLKAGDTGTGAFLFTPTADNVTPLTLSNSLTGASAIPTLAINPTWNTTGAPTALLVNATNTASDAAALLFDTQLNTVSVLNLRTDGRLSLAGRISAQTISPLGHILSNLDASTAGAITALTIGHSLSSGTAAIGFGTVLDWALDSTTTAFTRAARWVTFWSDPTHATRTSQSEFRTFQAGVEVLNLVLANGQVQGNPGTVAAPSFSNRNDTDTGMYFPAADDVAFSTAGVQRLMVSTTAVTSTLPILAPSGTITNPGFGFSADVDTGLYLHAVDVLGITALSIVLGRGTSDPRFTAFAGGVIIGREDTATETVTIGSNATTGIALTNNGGFFWSTTAVVSSTPITTGVFSLALFRDADNVLAQRNGTAAQTSRIYETTNAALTNYSRLSFQTQAGNHLIRTEAAGTGMLRKLQVGTGPSAGTNISGTNTIIHGGQSTGNAAGGAIFFETSPPGASGAGVNALVTVLTITTGGVAIHEAPVRLKGYTVATLPVGTQGDTAYVTNALAPSFGATVAGGGAVVIPVFYNGTNWIVG